MTEDNGSGKPPASAADRLATEIRRRRRAAGLSQRELARRCGYTREYVSMAERLGANVASRELVRALDDALDANGELNTLRAHALDEQHARRTAHRATATAPTPVLLDGIRRALLSPPDEPMPGAGDAIARAHARYQSADYDGTARLLSRILSGLGEAAPQLKAAAYLATAKLATKTGDTGLAWVAADRCATHATESGRADLIGVARYQVAAALLASGHDADAEEIAGTAVDVSGHDAVRGSLLLLLAIMAARRADGPLATQRLRQAARHADTDGNHLWTAFGPTNVAIHELGVHVALGDSRMAERVAERIDADALPAQLKGRRSQVHLELAAAAAGVHEDHLAVLHLLEAERVARQAIGRNTAARRLVGELLARERATPGLRALAVRAGVAA
jgi:transcriptional regulator with XRE-family HTH domain